MNELLFNWHLSATTPFVVEKQRYSNIMSYPHLDMHNSIHLGIIVDGTLSGVIGTENISLKTGDSYLISPWEMHGQTKSLESIYLLLITINPYELSNSLIEGQEAITTLFLLPFTRRHELLNTCLKKSCKQKLASEILNLEDEKSRYYKSKQWILLQQFFIKLFVKMEENNINIDDKQRATYTRLLPALRLIYEKSPVFVPEAAAACNIGTDYFSHLFKKCFGISFAAYELRYRLNCAANDLISKGEALKDLAYKYGFTDKSHFGRSFKKTFGTTPGKYKKKIR